MEDDLRSRIKVENLKPMYKLNDIEKESVYRHFVDSQKSHFESYIKFINSELCVLKHYGIVSDFTRFLARIKSVESSINNDNTKALNDIFGLEVDSATPGETCFIVKLFSETLEKTKEVIHTKTNKYVAHHYSGFPKAGNIVAKLEEIFNTTYDDKEMLDEYMENLPRNRRELMTKENKNNLKKYCEDFCNNLSNYTAVIKKSVYGEKLKDLKKDLKKVEQDYLKSEKLKNDVETDIHQPIIEGQFKTIQIAIEANIGSASHGDYKGENMKKVQKEYDEKGGLPLSRLPIMYKSNLETDDEGKPIPPKLLSSDETAKVLYPSLIVKKKESRGIE